MTDKLVSNIKIGGRTLAQFQKAFTRDAAIEEYVTAGGDREDARQMTKEDMFLEMDDIRSDKKKADDKKDAVVKTPIEKLKKGLQDDVDKIKESSTEDPAKSDDPDPNADKGSKKRKSVKSDKSSTSKKRKKKSTKPADSKSKQSAKAKRIQKKAQSIADQSQDNVEIMFGKKAPLDIVLKEGMLYKVDSHCWWAKSSRVPEEMLGNAPKKILKGVQGLIDEKHIAPLNSYRQRGERVVIKNGFPFAGFRGVYFVPKALIPKTEEGLEECQKSFYTEVDDFMKNIGRYKKQWAEFCKKNKVTVPPKEWYPSNEGIKSKFKFEWTKFSFSLPDKGLNLLTAEQYEVEKQKHKVKASQFLQSALTTVAIQFETILTKLTERLEKGESIKPKSLSSLRNFLETFESINITGNEDLSKMVTRMNKVIGSKNAKDINDSDKVRKTLTTKVGKLVGRVSTLIDEDSKFKRALDF